MHVGSTFSFFVFKFVRQFKIALNKHLHFVLVHLSVYLISTNFAKITYGYRLASHTTHLNSISKSKLVINGRLFKVSYLIINYTKIDMCKELSSNISNFLMLHVVLNGVIHVNRVNVAQFHVIDANTVVSQGLSMHVTNSSADLQEFLILRDRIFEFTEVIEQDASTVVGSALIP